MRIRDYNGSGKWGWEAIQARYLEYAARLGVSEPLDLKPRQFVQGDVRWIYPLMEQIIEGIKAGDSACATIGIEFIEEDGKFTFGANLKAQTARALRQSKLSGTQIARVRRRVTDMLIAGNVPREFREYVRLLRKVGFDELWPRLEAEVPRDNKYVMRYFGYLRAIHERLPAVVAR
jgi:hypothetical protein